VLKEKVQANSCIVLRHLPSDENEQNEPYITCMTWDTMNDKQVGNRKVYYKVLISIQTIPLSTLGNVI